MTHTETNGRIKLPWMVAVQIATALLVAGGIMAEVEMLRGQVTRLDAKFDKITTTQQEEHNDRVKQENALWNAYQLHILAGHVAQTPKR